MSDMKGHNGGTETSSASSHLGRKILIAVIAGLSINILLSLFYDFNQILSALKRATYLEILVPFLSIFAAYLIDSLRYCLIFRHFGVKLSFRDAFYNNVTGLFFSNITPSSAGGQPFQVYHFSRLGLESSTSTNIIFSRLMVMNIMQFIVILLSLKQGIALLSSSGNGSYILVAGMATTAILTLMLVLVFIKPTAAGTFARRIEGNRFGRLIGRLAKNEKWAERFSNWTVELRDSFRFLWAHRVYALLVDLLLFACDQVIWAYGLYYPLCHLSGETLPFLDFLFAFILCGLVSAYIPTPGSSGSVEASYGLVLGGMTGASGTALSAVFLWRFGSYYLHLLFGGLVYFFAHIDSKVYHKQPDGTVARDRRIWPPLKG